MNGQQGPPGKVVGPRRKTEGTTLDQSRPDATQATSSLTPVEAREHLRAVAARAGHGSQFCRWRHFDCNRRRREHAEFKALLAEMHPAQAPGPQTFGLEPGALRDHANSLIRDYGWTVEEVLAVLDVQLRAMP